MNDAASTRYRVGAAFVVSGYGRSWRPVVAAGRRPDRYQGRDSVDPPGPTFGEELRRFRLDRGYSLREFARVTNHSKSLIWEWEHSRKIPPQDVAARLDLKLDAAGELSALAASATPVAPSIALVSEIARHYAHQGAVADEIRRRAGDAKELDVLAVRALGISPSRTASCGQP